MTPNTHLIRAALFVASLLSTAPAFAQALPVLPDGHTVISTTVKSPIVAPPTLFPNVSFTALGDQPYRLFTDANLHSYHFDRAEKQRMDYNENNFGGGIEFTNDTLGVMAGYYRNSIWRPSFYLLGRWTPLHLNLTPKDDVAFGIVAGTVSGYVKQFTTTSSVTTAEAYGPFGTPNAITQRTTQWHTQGRGFMPAAGLALSYDHDQTWGVNLLFVPAVKSMQVPAFAALQMKAHLFSIGGF